MKKLFLLLIVASAFIACEDIEDNSPALQAEIDNVFFKSLGSGAKLNQDNSVAIQASTQDETVTLFITGNSLNSYELGGQSANFATFEDASGNVYTTVPNGSGVVTISETNQGTGISGSFEFSAILPGVDTLVAQKGIFYQVPFISQEIPIPGDGGEDPTVPNGSLVANVDGELFNSDIVETVVASDQIRIKGAVEEEFIMLFIPLDIEVGSVSLPSVGVRADYEIMGDKESAISGNLRVFEHDTTAKKIKGTFVFSTENHTVTMGQFNVDY
tara:strand:+ start:686492 stop:687307 length:816 start_codon:yes stop_codon:yes gene_type:complete